MKKVILSTLSVAVLGLGFTSIAEEEKTTEEVKQEATSIRLPFDPRNIKKAQEAYKNSSNRVDGQVKAMLILFGGEEPDSGDQVR